MADVYVYDLNESSSISDSDYVLINIGTGLKRIKFSILKQLIIEELLKQSSNTQDNAIE